MFKFLSLYVVISVILLFLTSIIKDMGFAFVVCSSTICASLLGIISGIVMERRRWSYWWLAPIIIVTIVVITYITALSADNFIDADFWEMILT